MSYFKVGQKVKVNKDISRVPTGSTTHAAYGTKGESGVVVEVFRPIATGGNEIKPPSAKVRMEGTGQIKTFRLSSLDPFPKPA